MAASQAAAQVFALALAVRRLCGLSRTGSGRTAPILWCAAAGTVRELGRLHGPGLCFLGLDPAQLVIAEPARDKDVLWTLEEGLKSESLALAVGCLDEVALTPARRLALAAAAHVTPCLLLTHPETEGAAATATRWRVAPTASAPHPFDSKSPGRRRFAVAIERCRTVPFGTGSPAQVLEWSDAAYRFRLASRVVPESASAYGAGRSAA